MSPRALALLLAAAAASCATSDDWVYRPRDAAADAPALDVQDSGPDAPLSDIPLDTDGPSPPDAPTDAPRLDAPADVSIDLGIDGSADAADAPGDLGADAPRDLGADVPVADAPPEDACPPGATRCGAACATLGTDPSHCGRCGNACPTPANTTPVCASGACDARCLPGFASCDGDAANGCEVDLQRDPARCGACINACPAGPHASPTCAAGACGRVTCEAGYGDCNGQAADGCEVDVRAAVANCGACGTACNLANATARCAAGACAIASCNAGFGDCDGSPANGCEASLATATNCLTCGTACPAGQVCAAGGCMVTCPGGQTLCSGACVSTDRDALHCGGCGRACAFAHALGTCASSACRLAACDPGYGDCDANPANGCEVDTRASVAHCGACGRPCAAPSNAASTCTGGTCGYACNAGYGDCDGNAANGCETNLQTAVGSCGACGRACSFANGAATCVGGACALGACNAGYGNCDGSAANGCETDTRTSVGSCGACGVTCSRPQSTARCVASQCTYACFPYWENLDGDSSNGCESDLLDEVVRLGTNPPSCGTAGTQCGGATAHCGGGRCSSFVRPAFVEGAADCDGNAANRAEASLLRDESCGACGRVCPGGQFCHRGSCVATACPLGRADCNGDPSDGCEADTDSDPYNCGFCYRWCPAGGAFACIRGGCTNTVCAAGTADCNGGPAGVADGCETNVLTSARHCGRCFEACPSGRSCVGGVCT